MIRNHIRSLASNDLHVAMNRKGLTDQGRYGRFLSIMAKSVGEDADQLEFLKAVINKYSKLNQKEFRELLVNHHQIFMNFDESEVIAKVEPVIRILSQHMGVEKLEAVLVTSFSQLMSVNDVESLHLIVSSISDIIALNSTPSTSQVNQTEERHKKTMGEILEVLVGGGELINLGLDRAEFHIGQAEEMLNWGYRPRDAVIHTFQKENQAEPLANTTVRELEDKRHLFEGFKMRSVATFLNKNEAVILKTPMNILQAGVREALAIEVKGTDLERWIQAGYFSRTDVGVDIYKELFLALKNYGQQKDEFTPQQVQQVIQFGQKNSHLWKFPHGLRVKIHKVLAHIEQEELLWLNPHLYALFSEKRFGDS